MPFNIVDTSDVHTSKPNSHTPAGSPLSTTSDHYSSILSKEQRTRDIKDKCIMFFQNKSLNIWVTFFLLVYGVVLCCELLFPDIVCEHLYDDFRTTVKVLVTIDFISLIILIFYVNLLAFAYAKYDWPYVFYMIIIGISIIMIIIDSFITDNSESPEWEQRLRELLRAFRLVLIAELLRDQYYRINTLSILGVYAQSPLDRTLYLLRDIFHRHNIPQSTKTELRVVTAIIASGQLYNSSREVSVDSLDMSDDALAWLTEVTNRATGNASKTGSVHHSNSIQVISDRARQLNEHGNGNIPMEIEYPDVARSEYLDFNLFNWNGFNCFRLNEYSNGNALVCITNYVLHMFNLNTSLHIDSTKFLEYSYRIQHAYRSANSYHNAVHAADVVQAGVYFMIGEPRVVDRLCIDEFNMDPNFGLFVVVLACMIHDVEHNGTNNAFHVKSGSPLSIRYNDRSVLENHHVSAAFALLRHEECNFLDGAHICVNDFRELVIEMVLETDMTNHFNGISFLKNKSAEVATGPKDDASSVDRLGSLVAKRKGTVFSSDEASPRKRDSMNKRGSATSSIVTNEVTPSPVLSPRSGEYVDIEGGKKEGILHSDSLNPLSRLNKGPSTNANRLWCHTEADAFKLLCILIHAADISNATRDVDVSLVWTERVMCEFFWQGDRELSLNLPVSILMDRKTQNIASGQKGYIDLIITPFYRELSIVIPNLKFLMNNISIIRSFWDAHASEMEDCVSKGRHVIPHPDINIPGKLEHDLLNMNYEDYLFKFAEKDIHDPGIPYVPLTLSNDSNVMQFLGFRDNWQKVKQATKKSPNRMDTVELSRAVFNEEAGFFKSVKKIATTVRRSVYQKQSSVDKVSPNSRGIRATIPPIVTYSDDGDPGVFGEPKRPSKNHVITTETHEIQDTNISPSSRLSPRSVNRRPSYTGSRSSLLSRGRHSYFDIPIDEVPQSCDVDDL